MSQEEDRSSTCPICMEEWTNSSDHRVCCLKCGHLFGRSCIEKWIKDQSANAKCPNCNKPTRKADIRNLWCRTIKAIDSTEVNDIRKQLENEYKLRRLDQAKVYHMNLKLELAYDDIGKLKTELEEKRKKAEGLQSILDKIIASNSNEGDNGLPPTSDIERIIQSSENANFVRPKELKGSFHSLYKIECSFNGGCKSIAISPTSSLAVVAQPTPTRNRNPFGDFGLRKYSIADINAAEFIPLHMNNITSFDLQHTSDLALTSSVDKKLKITSLVNNVCIQSYETEFEPKCVSWSSTRQHQFYVGYSNCYVGLFDIRNTSEHIYQSKRIANTKLLSGASIGEEDSDVKGFIFNDIKGCHFLEVSDASAYDDCIIDPTVEHTYHHSLPLTGIMGTVDYDKRSHYTLVSTRPNQSSPNCIHNLIKLEKVQDEEDGSISRVELRMMRSFLGGKSGTYLTKSKILSHPTKQGSVLVASHDEDSRGIKIWDASDNTVFQTIRSDLVRDISMLSSSEPSHLLFALSEKNLDIFRWDLA